MSNIFDFADELGPIKIVHVYDPKCGLKAVVAIDNVARGPSIGGIRMAHDVSAEEAFRLARAMTLKNSAANLPHGGGKSVIFGDPKITLAEKERLIRAFARAIRDLVEYIPGPDMGTDETCMAWVHDYARKPLFPLQKVAVRHFAVGSHQPPQNSSTQESA